MSASAAYALDASISAQRMRAEGSAPQQEHNQDNDQHQAEAATIVVIGSACRRHPETVTMNETASVMEACNRMRDGQPNYGHTIAAELSRRRPSEGLYKMIVDQV